MTVETKAKTSHRPSHGKKNGTAQESETASPRQSAGSTTDEVLSRREILAALRALERGDFSASLPDDRTGIDGEICTVFNDIVARAGELEKEVARVSTEFVEHGATLRRLRGARFRGGWARTADGVNATLDSLVHHHEAITSVVSIGDVEKHEQTNDELEEQARQLTAQRDEVENKNRQVELAKAALDEKAEQLALTSKYKSQFLANMSHELRTPLNSLLILSRQLADNPGGALSPRHVDFASTIHLAGTDLLSLINEILDLAKIESGTMAIDVVDVRLAHLEAYVTSTFAPTAAEKGLDFVVEVSEACPPTVSTDDMRLKQVLRNLLANALKFTHQGRVTLRIDVADAEEAHFTTSSLASAPVVLAFSVHDTGVGVDEDKQQLIFEAFQQADGSTSRKYGGTGLGLSISREIAGLLGGELRVWSRPGVGSEFTLYLPQIAPAQSRSPASFGDRPAPTPPRTGTPTYGRRVPSLRPPQQPPSGRSSAVQRVDRGGDTSRLTREQAMPETALPSFGDDRAHISADDRVLLIVEDDPTFASILLDVARDNGFKGVVALGGRDGFELARALRPDAITLDLMLPDMDGWIVLDRLKHDGETRHIPVHIISAKGDERRGMASGAVALLHKPVEKRDLDAALTAISHDIASRFKRLLVVEDDDEERAAIVALIGEGDVETTAVATAEEALVQLEAHTFDCAVIDLTLPELCSMRLVERLQEQPMGRRTPVIVYSGRELNDAEQLALSKLAQTAIITDVRSRERLLEETTLFLHRVESTLPEAQRALLDSLADDDPALAGKTVLIVDDDVRNVFAVTAVLEQRGVLVEFAENGREALDKLASCPAIDGVLMDIMMPEMDGYEATRRIRANREWSELPVIALTAKAMRGDRERCIAAGASDYVAKPVDSDQLLSMLRVWLSA